MKKTPAMYCNSSVDCIDVATLVRTALREAFPSIKFSVKTRRFGVNVEVTDGPTHEEIATITKRFKGLALLDGYPVMFDTRIRVVRQWTMGPLARAIRHVFEEDGHCLPSALDAFLIISNFRHNCVEMFGEGHDKAVRMRVKKKYREILAGEGHLPAALPSKTAERVVQVAADRWETPDVRAAREEREELVRTATSAMLSNKPAPARVRARL